jgi:hypothetical protein
MIFSCASITRSAAATAFVSYEFGDARFLVGGRPFQLPLGPGVQAQAHPIPLRSSISPAGVGSISSSAGYLARLGAIAWA